MGLDVGMYNSVRHRTGITTAEHMATMGICTSCMQLNSKWAAGCICISVEGQWAALHVQLTYKAWARWGVEITSMTLL